MKNKILIIVLCILNYTASYSQSPNILLIIADDLGVDALNGYNIGSLKPTTPNLDSIRNNGLTFSNAWSSSVCTPTRAGIMSGMYGSNTGVKTTPGNLDTSYISLFNALKHSSPTYKGAVIGKWHISNPINGLHPIWHGVDHYMGILTGSVMSYDSWDKTENNVTTNSTNYITSYLTDDAISWIDNQNNPWFLWLAHVAPHTPIHIPPANMYTQLSTNSPIKKYMAMIESLDYEIGRLLNSLTPSEKANTTIIFIGDNGTPNNLLQDYPANHGKSTLFQGGIHVPMFVSGHGVTRIGETENALVNVIDIYASVLEISGTNLPGGIYNSLSFKHLLTSSILPKRQFNFSEIDTNQAFINTQGYTIRDSTYKLIVYYTGQQEMFNIMTDPLETNDLLQGTLLPNEQNLKSELENEANQRITAWSCKDDIQNGNEQGIDCGGTYCSPCSTTSINESIISNSILVYPNPAKNILHIKWNKNINHVRIIDKFGKVIKAEMISKNTINIESLKQGAYLIEIVFEDKVITKKFIK
tara:strand:+ start:115 stop:1698 length:1584 start_codon:yes stop_codon:yes gene_type:complete